MEQRTLNQNSALHLYFKELSEEFTNRGIDMHQVLPNNIEIPITQAFLKDIFRAIGKTMFNKKSTADLTKQEFNKVEEVFTKWVSQVSKGDISIDFPSYENKKG